MMKFKGVKWVRVGIWTGNIWRERKWRKTILGNSWDRRKHGGNERKGRKVAKQPQ